ncbi:MAG TPA: 23S rRNA (guanosine(2251)-2'-O)-methyltransferase RlmB [Spirochaetia bacterium]|nr:23S rRNA (guanosine(2251)-2'-O)-methyltransferase RlmB [Spirochaetia bacterium]
MAEYLFGFHTIEETLRRGVSGASLLVSRENARIARLREAAESRGVPVSEVDDGELTQLCGTDAHRGAVLVLSRTPASLQKNLRHLVSAVKDAPALVLVLDGVTDPQNLGAILRSADQFAADIVVIPSRRSAQETQTVAKVSAGASAYVPLAVVANIPSALDLLTENGFWIFGADIQGQTTDTLDLSGKTCLVLGSEGTGMRRLVREKCDFLVRIPAAGHVDSFNVSVAAGILLFEARRQQGFPHITRK